MNRWTINCKYYTADINLCTSHSLNELSDQFIHNINAIIILFNNEKVYNYYSLNSSKYLSFYLINILDQYYRNEQMLTFSQTKSSRYFVTVE